MPTVLHLLSVPRVVVKKRQKGKQAAAEAVTDSKVKMYSRRERETIFLKLAHGSLNIMLELLLQQLRSDNKSSARRTPPLVRLDIWMSSSPAMMVLGAGQARAGDSYSAYTREFKWGTLLKREHALSRHSQIKTR